MFDSQLECFLIEGGINLLYLRLIIPDGTHNTRSPLGVSGESKVSWRSLLKRGVWTSCWALYRSNKPRSTESCSLWQPIGCVHSNATIRTSARGWKIRCAVTTRMVKGMSKTLMKHESSIYIDSALKKLRQDRESSCKDAQYVSWFRQFLCQMRLA